MIELDALVRAHAGTFALETVRVTGVIIAAPLAWLSAPLRVRGTLVLLIAFAAHAEGSGGLADQSIEQMAFSVGSEFMLGLGIGFVVRLFVAVAEMAAEYVAPMMGIGAAQLFDPQTKAMQNVLSSLFRNFAVLLGLLAGIHRVVLSGVLASFRAVPVGTLTNPALETPVVLAMTSEALATGVRIAIPFIAILFMSQIALAFISRAAPAMQIFSIGFAVTMATGALVMVLVLPDLGYELLGEVSRSGAKIETLLAAVR
ncbi:MAG TPA: flagellar biosynthetic protein FliR [Polyangiaceae bacterium]|nr:flagellar biosynthetic protein FliR [Polyangiaceae bacterium]